MVDFEDLSSNGGLPALLYFGLCVCRSSYYLLLTKVCRRHSHIRRLTLAATTFDQREILCKVYESSQTVSMYAFVFWVGVWVRVSNDCTFYVRGRVFALLCSHALYVRRVLSH